SLLYSNRAACHLKLKRWESAILDASASLLCDGDNLKAYHRRSLACRHLGRLKEAVQDLE
ncbi:hypothetical protein GUITHDRAFT_57884, partial [Guillardia theta CCMP2712]